MDDSKRELHTLQPGNQFEVIGLEHFFRKLTVVHINDSCVTVDGEVMVEGSNWRTLQNHTMSCRTEVRILNK